MEGENDWGTSNCGGGISSFVAEVAFILGTGGGRSHVVDPSLEL